MKWTWLPASKFAQIESKWQMFNECHFKSILLDKIFVRYLIKVFGTEKERIGLCYRDNQLVAMGIFVKTGIGRFSTFQPSQAPIGMWMVHEDVKEYEIVSSLIKQFPGINGMVSILHQDPDKCRNIEDHRMLQIVKYIQTSCIQIEGSFDDYWAKRSKNLRHNLKRQRNRLKKEGIITRLEMVTRSDEIIPAVEAYGDLETSGWKAGLGTNIHISNDQGQFYSHMLKEFSLDDRAVIFKYWYNDQLVASNLCLNDKKTLIILKTTYDEAQKTSSPAFLLLENIVQYVFESTQIEKIEFFGKVMDWHKKWVDKKDIRQMFHNNWYRYSFAKTGHKVLTRLKSK